MDLTLTFVGLDMEFKKTTVKGGFNYLNEQFSVETKVRASFTPANQWATTQNPNHTVQCAVSL